MELSDLPRQRALALYETLFLIRRFEERVARLFAQGAIPGFIHLCLGQEATATGACAALRPDDYVLSTHRGHGHVLAKGADPGRVLAEILGRETGYCRGRGGSMHVAVPELGVLGANGVVGAGLPLAVGAALSARVRGTDQVALAFFGEGATGTGAFHEAVNFAAVQRLPVVFFCENNRYAEFTPPSVHMRVDRVAERARAYGIPGVTVDGGDVLAVLEATDQAVARARRGEGPTLVEALTERWRGHFEGDQQKYRDRADIDRARERDPVQAFRARLAAGGVAEEELAAVEARVEARLEEAAAFAGASPQPGPEKLAAGLYA